MKYSDKAIDELINRMSNQWCVNCVLKSECKIKGGYTKEECANEIERILENWRDK